MDLSTTYLGFKLAHPIIPGASPWGLDLDKVRLMEDAGAAAIVMPSLFEEQIIKEQLATAAAMDTPAESFAEALSYFPNVEDFRIGPDEYVEKIAKIKKAVKVPVIASLNGVTKGGWLDYARLMAQAGADALELNVYYLPTDMDECGRDVENRAVELLTAVKAAVKIPVAVKLSPFYSSIPCIAGQLDKARADGLVLFNRFYQPDINVETLEAERVLHLSTSEELLLRLRWLAVLSGRVSASLACSGGVHTVADVVKAIMTGANAVQLVSEMLRHGPQVLKTLRTQLAEWLEKHEYDSLQQMQGSMNLTRCPDPGAYERANYVHILQTWKA
jgi:dihydroorotate dehydrogenase (fumarate)